MLNPEASASVVFVNRYFYPDHSATSQLATDLARYLQSRDVAVSVITSRQLYGDRNARLPAFERVDGIRIHRVGTTRFGRGSLLGRLMDYLSFYVSAGWQLVCRADRNTTVIAMTDPPLISVVASLAVRLRGARLVNWHQDVFPEVAEQLGVLSPGVRTRLLRKLRDISVRVAVENVVIGTRMRDTFTGVPKKAPQVIANWALEEGESQRGELRDSWGLGTKFVIGYSGNMGRSHYLDIVVRAAQLLRDQDKVVFLLVGDGIQRRQLESQVLQFALDNVKFQPYQPRERLRELLSVPDVHLVSLDARLEGLIIPSKFVGVIALGRPVLWIGDPAGEVGSLVTQYACGLNVTPGDPGALAEAIRHLSSSPETLQAMGANATRLWQEKFQRITALQRWHDLLVSPER